jgi:cytochrome bd-type quinol oxidase subunit 1
MSWYITLGGAITMAVGITLEGIACAITGIRSLKTNDTQIKQSLVAASATIGFGTILMIVCLVLLFMFNIKKKVSKKRARPFGIASLIIGILSLMLFITGATLAGVFSTRYPDDKGVRDALRAAAILVAVGILHLIVGFAIVYITINQYIGKYTRYIPKQD